MNTVLLLITLNLVMIEENGSRRQEPAQLLYSDHMLMLGLVRADTIEIYRVDQKDIYKGAIIIRVSTLNCRGFLRIYVREHIDRGGAPQIRGSVYFFKYCDHEPVDRMFSIDRDRSVYLVKKLQAKRKKESRRKLRTKHP